ncbi:MAG: hypothetical protein M1814_005926 [Vezdaea aestivalis]|nr:MAG: hypothetical protein M1814_005926 [Vezdaea aestivalis]
MVLTKQSKTPKDPSKFPTVQLFLLALVRCAEPIALTSILPIAYPMTKGFLGETDASFYAGLLIAAFALTESCTGMLWGGLSDRYGRKPILLFGCLGTVVSLLIVGLAPNYPVALIGRALGGLLNGNVGVIQTMVGELVTLPAHEPRAYAIMPFVWSIGTIVGPAIGGTFAKPVQTFPKYFSKHSIWDRFPYLLPLLICIFILLAGIVLGWLLIEETHPDMQPWSTEQDYKNTEAETPLMATAAAIEHPGVDLRGDSYGTFNAVDIEEHERWFVHADGTEMSKSEMRPDVCKKVFTKQVLLLVLALGIFTFHCMTYDCLLPIFFQDDRQDINAELVVQGIRVEGGLGLTTNRVGVIMSINGVIALFIQAVIFPLIAEWLGIWKTFITVTVLHPLAYFIVPFLVTVPSQWLYPAIYTCLSIRNLLSILAYPVLLILIKEATPSRTDLGRINGLAASAGAACRTMAPPISGYLYDVGSKLGFTGLAWWASGLVALIGAFQCWSVRQEKYKTAHVRPVVGRGLEHKDEAKEEVVQILVDVEA